MLQWGRDEGVAEEIGSAGGAAARGPPLRWGRDEGVAEEMYDFERAMQPLIASMGPRRGCRGRGRSPCRTDRGIVASMGPRRGCRGRAGPAIRRSYGWRCFNGAATRVSRKRLTWAADRAASGSRFNGAATRVSRKSSRRTSPAQRSSRFNGAATRVSRKRADLRVVLDGRVAQFNGAATRVSRKSSVASASGTGGQGTLQWGRDEGVAEENPTALNLGRGRLASMGPRRGCRGRVDDTPFLGIRFNASMGPRRGCRGRGWLVRGGSSRARSRFNGAATRVSRKRSFQREIAPVVISLQWGRDEGVAEESGGRRQAQRKLAASMGPRRGCRGRGGTSFSPPTR